MSLEQSLLQVWWSENYSKLSHVSENYCNSPSLFFATALCTSCQDFYFRVDWWSDPNKTEDVALWGFLEDISFLRRKWEHFFSPCLSGVPCLLGSVHLMLIDWNPLGATRGHNVLERGALELCWCERGEGWGFSLFPGSFCLRHSPLMRVNEDKLVWV